MFGISINEELMSEQVAKIPIVADKNQEIKELQYTDLCELLQKYGEADYDSLSILQSNYVTLSSSLKSN